MAWSPEAGLFLGFPAMMAGGGRDGSVAKSAGLGLICAPAWEGSGNGWQQRRPLPPLRGAVFGGL